MGENLQGLCSSRHSITSSATWSRGWEHALPLGWVWHWASCSYAWSPWLRRARSKLLSGVPQVQCVECFVKEEEWLA
eukprot:scaffold74718_cov17-Tisochrysis_lutea.AAC.2